MGSTSGRTRRPTWADWSVRRMYALSGAAVIATDFMKTFLDYPQRQQPGNFNVDAIMQQL